MEIMKLTMLFIMSMRSLTSEIREVKHPKIGKCKECWNDLEERKFREIC